MLLWLIRDFFIDVTSIPIKKSLQQKCKAAIE